MFIHLGSLQAANRVYPAQKQANYLNHVTLNHPFQLLSLVVIFISVIYV